MAFSVPTVRSTPPMQVRFFDESDTGGLEQSINQWLAEHPRSEIVDVRQTAVSEGAETRLIVSVWYIED